MMFDNYFDNFEDAKKEAISFVKGNAKYPGMWDREYYILHHLDGKYSVVRKSELFSFQERYVVYSVSGEYKFGLKENKCIVRGYYLSLN